MELRIASVEIMDVLGAREMKIEPSGRITWLHGKNASGKSSALVALQAALGGGSLSKLARIDAKGKETDPKVVLVIEGNGAQEYRVQKTGDELRVRGRIGETAAFEDIPRPQAWLAKHFDVSGCNPVRFLHARDKDQVLMLLEALPGSVDPIALRHAMGLTAEEMQQHVPGDVGGMHAFHALAAIRESIFRKRTGVNREAKDKAASAEQMRLSSPAKTPADLTTEIEQGQSAVENLASEIARRETEAQAILRQTLAEAEHTHKAREGEVWSDFEAAAAEIRAKSEAKIAELREIAQDASDTLRKTRDEQKEQARKVAQKAEVMDLASQRADLTAGRVRLGELRGQKESADKIMALLEQAARFDQEALAREEEGRRLTVALDVLDEKRRRLAESIPIRGLTIDETGLRIGGIPFDQVNTAERMRVAVKVACLRKGKLPVVFVDGAEALDSEHREALAAAIEAEGVQAFVAAVTDSELSVESSRGARS